MKKYHITAHVTTNEVSYKNGEFGNVEYYSHSETVNADNAKKALEIFLEKGLYFEDVEVYQDEEVGIFADTLVDVEGYQASEFEIDQWKGEWIKLFNAHFSFEIYELTEVKTLD